MSLPREANCLFPGYMSDQRALRRLWNRWQLVGQPIRQEIAGSRILDLAAHDGRWAYAAAVAGAGSVVAVEPRPELVQRFSDIFDAGSHERIRFECTDAQSYLELAILNKERFDIVFLLGFLYHTLEHMRMLSLIGALRPKLIVVDSEFVQTDNPVIQLTRERTDNPLNAVSNFIGEKKAMVGIPSVGAMELYSDSMGYDLTWIDPAGLNLQNHAGLGDYFRTGRKRRQVCLLRPPTSSQIVT